MTPEEKKLEKLNSLFELVNQDFATPDDLVKLSELLLSIFLKEKDRVQSLIGETEGKIDTKSQEQKRGLQELENSISTAIAQLQSQFSGDIDTVKSQIDTAIKAVEKKIPSKTDLSGIESDIQDIKDSFNTLPTELTINNEAIRDGLELLEGQERLDKSAIKGLDDYDEVARLARTPKEIVGAGVKLLRYLSDVNIEGITNGQTIIWNTTLQRFEAGSGGGGASPLTTKGDLYTYDTADARLPVGTDGQALFADSTQAKGIKWGNLSGGGDMLLATVQTVSALKTYLTGTLGLRNVANTFTSFFTNTNTASRTYTLQDADGTIAFTSDITGTNSGTNTGDQLLFKTISVSGQSDVVADSTTDTLTLVAGTNVTITTNAATDAITINSTASGTGDVVGPASATDNAIARFDATTGKLIQNSTATIADSGNAVYTNTGTGDMAQFVNTTNTRTTLINQWGDIILDAAAALFGTLGSTGTRIVKLWATDIESTNMPTVGGVSLSTTFAAASHTHTSAAITDFTEAAQDATGAMVDTSLVYTDATPLLQRAALTGAITASAGSNTTALGSFTTAQLNTALSDNDVATGGGTATGTNTGDQTITLTSDVTGSGTGSFATTIAAQAVSLAKMANVATSTVFYRKTAGTGSPEVQTLATLKTDLGLTGTNSGDQTITLTGEATGSGTGSFAVTLTNSAVIGKVLTGLSLVSTTVISATDTILVALGSLQAQITALTTTVSGKVASTRTINTTAPLSGGGDLSADRTLTTSMATNKLIGRGTAGTGVMEEITLGTNLSLSGTTLNASGGGGTTTNINTVYVDQSGGTSDTYGVLSGTINGSNAVFTVSQSIYATGTLKVYLNGQLQTQGSAEDWVETTPASGTFTFAVAPATGSLITVEYQKVTTSSATLLAAITETEVDFGTPGTNRPVIEKTFTVTDASITSSHKIICTESGNTATGRQSGDSLWDSINYTAVSGTGSFTLYAKASGGIVGKRKLYYTYS